MVKKNSKMMKPEKNRAVQIIANKIVFKTKLEEVNKAAWYWCYGNNPSRAYISTEHVHRPLVHPIYKTNPILYKGINLYQHNNGGWLQ